MHTIGGQVLVEFFLVDIRFTMQVMDKPSLTTRESIELFLIIVAINNLIHNLLASRLANIVHQILSYVHVHEPAAITNIFYARSTMSKFFNVDILWNGTCNCYFNYENTIYITFESIDNFY